MKSKRARRWLAGVLGLTMLVGDVFGGSSLAAYAGEVTEEAVSVEESTEDAAYAAESGTEYAVSAEVSDTEDIVYESVESLMESDTEDVDPTIWVDEDYLEYYVSYGERVTLSVSADSELELTYRWLKHTDEGWVQLEGESESQYVLEAATEYGYYLCYVENAYYVAAVSFNVYVDTGLSADEDYFYYPVGIGDTITLSVADCVTVTSGVELFYQWSTGGNAIEGATESSYTIDSAASSTYYRCDVTDSAGNTVFVDFQVYVESGLNIGASESTVYVDPGESATVSVIASVDAGSLSYEWYYYDANGDYVSLDSTENEDGTESSVTVPNITQSTTVWCYVTDDYGNRYGTWITVGIDTGLSVENNSFNYYIEPGTAVSLSAADVTVNDGVALTYQWYLNWDEIEGATEATYTTEALTAWTWYRCRVTDSYGNLLDLYYYVYIDTGLSADETWFGYEVEAGSQSVLSAEDVTINEGYTLSYQWYKNWSEIEGATTATYTTDEASSNTYYQCRVSDEYGNVVDLEYYLYIRNSLSIDDCWFYPTVSPGETVTLSAAGVTADDGVELTYHWYQNWEEIEGATDATYTTDAITSYSRYECIVYDEYGNNIYLYFEVCIDTGLSDVDAWTEYTVEPGDSVDMSAEVVTADEGITLYYQWYQNDDAIEGATEATYTAENITRATLYCCIVTDGYGNYEEVYYNIFIENGLTVTDWDSTVYMDSDGNAQISVTATVNEGSISYLWYYNSDEEGYTVLSGEDTEGGSVLSLTDVTPGTWYYCCVSDDYGNEKTVSCKVTVDTSLSASQTYYSYKVSPNDSITLSTEYVTVNDGYTLSYQWFLDGYSVSGATDSTYTIDPVTSYHYLECQVTDGYGNYVYLYYDVYVENNLTVDYSSVTLEIGETADLTVTATADSGSLTYMWYSSANGEYFEYEGIADEDGLCTLPGSYVTKAGYYYCCVWDEYNNSTTASVRVRINTGLGTEDGGNTYYAYVAYGETAVLDASVVTVNDGIALYYEWDYDWDVIDGETGVTYTTDPVTSRGYYHCLVTDEFGNYYWLYFYVYVDNNLTVSYEDDVTVAYGEDVTLSFTVSADDMDGITCTWYGYEYQTDEYQDFEETSTSLTLSNVTSSGWYECYIVDKYGNSKYAWFEVSVNTGLTKGSYDNSCYVAPGGSTTLSVNATANDGITLTYRWYEDYETLEGETGATLTLMNITENAYYQCEVSDGCGNSIWFYLYVYVDNELTIESYGGTVYVLSGDSTELSVKASVLTGGIYYAWYVYDEEEGYVSLEEAGAALTLADVTESAEYWCRVTDDYGNVLSAYYYVTVTETLRVMAGEYIDTIKPGESTTLSVEAVTYNTDDLTYQWYLGIYDNYYAAVEYTAIEGATGSTYTVNASDLVGKGGYRYYYKCVVSDGEAERSAYMYVSLDSGLTIEGDNSYQFVSYGESVDLTLTASSDISDAEFSFQWYDVTYEGNSDDTVVYTPITSGVTTSGNKSVLSLTVTEYGEYRCVISDGYQVRNIYFYVYVDTGLTAGRGLDSYSQTIDAGETVDLTVVASTNQGTLTYQWYSVTFGLISGATSDTLTVGTQGYYYCSISDGCNSTNVSYYVYVSSGFSYSYASEGSVYTVKEGETVDIAVSASTEKGTLSYQWYRMTGYDVYEAISGATASTLTVEGDAIGDVNYYRCVVTDGYQTSYLYLTVYVIGETATTAGSAVELTDSAYASIAESGDLMYFVITPTVSGTYTFYSKNTGYTVAYLYDADMHKLKYNDGYEEYGDFQITYDLEAGKTYYLACGYYYSYSSYVGSFLVCMECDAMTDIAECDVTLGSDSFTYNGKAQTTTVTVKDGSTTLTENTDYTVTYSDDNTDAGTATITIKGIGNYNGQVEKEFTISKASQTVTATAADPSITYGKTTTITASTTGDGALSYSSSNTSVATVSSNGTVTAKGAGTATITVTAAATTNYNKATKTVKITVTRASQTLTVSSTSVSLAVDKTSTPTVSGAKTTLSYKSSDTSVATVNSSGKITAKKVGTATITVTAAQTACYSKATKTITVKVKPAATTVSSVTNTTSGVKITWKKVTGATGYYVYRATSKNGTYTQIAKITSGSTVTYTTKTSGTYKVTSGKTYYYKVSAYASTGTASKSAAKSVKYLTAGKVSSLTNTSSGITVKWSKVSGASGYYVYRKAGSGSYSKVKTIKSASTVSWTDTGVKSKNGTTYTYKVVPYSGSSTGSFTAKKTVRLTAVSISSLKNSSSKKMTVKWAKNSKATGYQIQYSTSSSFKSGNKTVTVSKAATTSKVISSLTKGKTYYVRIRTYKTVSGTKYYSAWSSKKSVKISK